METKYRIRYTNARGGGAKDTFVTAYSEESAIEKFLASRFGRTAGVKILVISRVD
jgi:hypothetical protein